MKKLHQILGLSISIVVIVVSLTGVALLWKREFLWIDIPAARELPIENPNYARISESILASYDTGEVSFIRFYSEGLSVHKVFLSQRRYAWHDQDGKFLQEWSSNKRVEDWLLDLHHRLLLGNNVGLQIVGFSSLFLIFLAVLGLLIWWPWRKSYRANLMPKAATRSAIRKSHFDTGVTLFAPILLIAITGLILVYPQQARWVISDGFGQPSHPRAALHDVAWSNSLPSLVEVFSYASNAFPESSPKWLSIGEESSKITVGVQEAESWNRMGGTSVSFTADRVRIKRFSEQRTQDRLLDFSYPLHTGKLPTWYRVLLSFSGFLLAWLALLGLISNRKGASKASR